MKKNIVSVLTSSPLMLTEGAVGQRLEHEYDLKPDEDIWYAAHLYTQEGRKALSAIYRDYLSIAEKYELPLLLFTNTRRSNQDRVMRSSFRDKSIMLDFARFLKDLAANYSCPVFIGGQMGCQNDAFRGTEGLSLSEAVAFHRWQAEQFRDTPVDLLFAGIMPTLEEAMGMAQVMAETGKPYIISLMISTGGTLMDGTPISDAIEAIDSAASPKPLCYMSNCIHPDIVREALLQPFNQTETVKARYLGLQANAACFDPAVLDGSPELYTTSATEWTDAFEALDAAFPIKIAGGCCGTDGSHIEALARRFTAIKRSPGR